MVHVFKFWRHLMSKNPLLLGLFTRWAEKGFTKAARHAEGHVKDFIEAAQQHRVLDALEIGKGEIMQLKKAIRSEEKVAMLMDQDFMLAFQDLINFIVYVAKKIKSKEFRNLLTHVPKSEEKELLEKIRKLDQEIKLSKGEIEVIYRMINNIFADVKDLNHVNIMDKVVEAAKEESASYMIYLFERTETNKSFKNLRKLGSDIKKFEKTLKQELKLEKKEEHSKGKEKEQIDKRLEHNFKKLNDVFDKINKHFEDTIKNGYRAIKRNYLVEMGLIAAIVHIHQFIVESELEQLLPKEDLEEMKKELNALDEELKEQLHQEHTILNGVWKKAIVALRSDENLYFELKRLIAKAA